MGDASAVDDAANAQDARALDPTGDASAFDDATAAAAAAVAVHGGAPAAAFAAGSRSRATGPSEVTLYPPAEGNGNVRQVSDRGEGQRILDRVFGIHYLKDWSQCPPKAGELAAARREGNLVPQVIQAASGSFTAAGTLQTLYLVADFECGATQVDDMGSTTLAVFEGERLVARVLAPGSTVLGQAIDVRGRTEIVLLHVIRTTGNIVVTFARLVRLDSASAVVIKDFGRVSESHCEPGAPRWQRDKIVYVRLTPDAGPDFRFERKEMGCVDPD